MTKMATTKSIKTKSSKNSKPKSTKSTKSTGATKSTTLTTWGKIWRLALAIIIPLGGGFLISLLTRNAMNQFDMLKQPPLAPPAWLFPVAWTILYCLMGIASYLIYLKFRQSNKSTKPLARTALILYAVQLIFNFLWTPLFFNANLYWFAFGILLTMWALEIALLVFAFKVSKPAFWCLIPYLLWTTFAAYLNLSIAILN